MREPIQDQAHRLREIVAQKRAQADSNDGEDSTTATSLLDQAVDGGTDSAGSDTSIELDDAIGSAAVEIPIHFTTPAEREPAASTERVEARKFAAPEEIVSIAVPEQDQDSIVPIQNVSAPEPVSRMVEIETPEQNDLVEIIVREEDSYVDRALLPDDISGEIRPTANLSGNVHILPAPPRNARLPVAGDTRILAITSGKGGVGKTNVTCNLALAMSRMGKRVLVFDADLSLANVDILLGLTPHYNLSHVVSGEKSMKEILVEAAPGFFVVPGVSGIEEYANLSTHAVGRLLDGFSALEDVAEILLIDTSAGIHHMVMSFLLAADQVVLVTTPEPTAYMDAYALIKVLTGHDRTKSIQAIVNMATNDAEGREVIRLLTSMCRQWLGVGFDSLGVIPRDVDVLQSVRHNAPVLTHSPHSMAAKRLRHIAAAILQGKRPAPQAAGLRGFMTRVLTRLRMAG